MEIISYLDSIETTRRQSPKFIKLLHVNKKRTHLIPYSPSSVSEDAPSVNDFLVSSVRALKYFLLNHFVLWVVVMLLATIVLFSFSFYFHTSQFMSNVPFAPLSATESDFLDSAMNRFAFSQTVFVESDELFNNEGQLLSADGQTIDNIPHSFFSKPVTFETYTVRSNDTISGITRKFGLSNISTLIAVNNITNVRYLRSGQKLIIPSLDGLKHTVTKGESLDSLSVKYQVTVEELLDVNDLSESALQIGQVLFIPGARLDSEKLKETLGDTFINPLKGLNWRLTSSYGTRNDPFTGVKSFHTGVDFAIAQGTPVAAAMSGRVAAAGFTPTYGNYVIINHSNGYQTLYAHLSKISVKSGQTIDQGGRVGLVGSTGYSTGPHLHFTVYKNGKLINPLTVIK